MPKNSVRIKSIPFKNTERIELELEFTNKLNEKETTIFKFFKIKEKEIIENDIIDNENINTNFKFKDINFINGIYKNLKNFKKEVTVILNNTNIIKGKILENNDINIKIENETINKQNINMVLA